MFNLLVLRNRLAAKLVLGAVIGLIWTSAVGPSAAVGSVSPLTNPARI
jgi:hypothetical protein